MLIARWSLFCSTAQLWICLYVKVREKDRGEVRPLILKRVAVIDTARPASEGSTLNHKLRPGKRYIIFPVLLIGFYTLECMVLTDIVACWSGLVLQSRLVKMIDWLTKAILRLSRIVHMAGGYGPEILRSFSEVD